MNNEKTKVEELLDNICVGRHNIVVEKNKIKNTVVKYKDEIMLNIFYRASEIRINVKIDSEQYKIYKTLLDQGIAYQKPTADPTNANPGYYAFFVKNGNYETALSKLIIGLNHDTIRKDRWNRENYIKYSFRFNIETDKDIIQKLNQVPSKNGYIRELIKKDIAK